MTFRPGQSGNPQGRRAGSRNKATLAIESLLEGEADAIGRKAIELAKEGFPTALRLCLDRLCPVRKDRHVAFKLPTMKATGDTVKAMASIAKAVAIGALTPSEAAELGKVVETFAKALQIHDHEQRLRRLESERPK